MISVAHMVLALLGVNVAAFGAFWWDKRCARAGSWRISESTLLSLALVGGSVGAVCAQHLFRHKTRNEPFRTMLYAIVALQLAAVVVLVIWLIAPHWLAGLLQALRAMIG
ncbi:DUF1294 domain-containing protein [Mesorhizobium sp. ANAO-SY3R2]|uniref:DUF1294 domain-containing protein n=1 Tax=Mesorhizobium sp. ANAO-SY3R2 TaxID=3166644 RepID=UPI0036732B58